MEEEREIDFFYGRGDWSDYHITEYFPKKCLQNDLLHTSKFTEVIDYFLDNDKKIRSNELVFHSLFDEDEKNTLTKLVKRLENQDGKKKIN